MQLKDAVVGLLVECMATDGTNVQGKIIKVTQEWVLVKFVKLFTPYDFNGDCVLRDAWYFAPTEQGDISDIDTHIINNLRQLADKQNSKEANKMLNKETLQDQLKQITQTIEGTEAALKGMRSYKALLEAGVKNYETMESVAIMPATLAKGLMDWANVWGGAK